MRNIIATILILTSLGLFIFFIKPIYSGKEVNLTSDLSSKGIKELKTISVDYKNAVVNSKAIVAKRTELQNQKKSFKSSDLKNIDNLLPDNIDNVQLLLDLNGVAKRYGMLLKSVKVEGQNNAKEGQVGVSKDQLGSINVSFNVTSSYETFLKFLRDLETSLRIVDVTKVSFKPTDTGVYNYSMTIKTYWLRK